MGYNEGTDKATRDRLQREATACDHAERNVIGKGYRPNQGAYTVSACAECTTRFNAFDDGTTEAVVTFPPADDPKSFREAFDHDPSVYVPRNDGIDAFNEADDSDRREPLLVNLFDTRGGRGGIGDDY